MEHRFIEQQQNLWLFYYSEICRFSSCLSYASVEKMARLIWPKKGIRKCVEIRKEFWITRKNMLFLFLTHKGTLFCEIATTISIKKNQFIMGPSAVTTTQYKSMRKWEKNLFVGHLSRCWSQILPSGKISNLLIRAL